MSFGFESRSRRKQGGVAQRLGTVDDHGGTGHRDDGGVKTRKRRELIGDRSRAPSKQPDIPETAEAARTVVELTQHCRERNCAWRIEAAEGLREDLPPEVAVAEVPAAAARLVLRQSFLPHTAQLPHEDAARSKAQDGTDQRRSGPAGTGDVVNLDHDLPEIT